MLLTTYAGNPSDYKSLLGQLKPGDTLSLAAGSYGTLQVSGLHGTSTSWITITGPTSGSAAVIQGASGYNTVEITNSTYLAIKSLTIDSKGIAGAAGISAKGGFSNLTHDILIEDNIIQGVGGSQQTDGISTKTPTWDWTIRSNTINGAGTGLYLGNSDGSDPFINGVIEGNLIENPIGYCGEIKYQQQRLTTDPNYIPYYAAGMPAGTSNTLIHDNVFIKNSAHAPDGDRPNFLVGGFPSSGPGSNDTYQIYRNLFDHNPYQPLLQASGRVSVHDNVFVDGGTQAIALQDQDLPLQLANVYNNTIYSVATGVRVASTHAPTVRVVGNLVFATTPFSGVTPLAGSNITDTVANASKYVTNPSLTLGQMNFYPKSASAVTGPALNMSAFTSDVDYSLDFNGTPKGTFVYRGAYAGWGTNPGWQLQAGLKPLSSLTAPTGLTATAPSGSQISLSWNAVLGASDYLVQRSLNGGTGWTTVATLTATDYEDSGLQASTAYYYRVAASNATGSGPYSADVVATIT